MRAERRGLAVLLLALALSAGGAALAHATIVFGTITTEPAPPAPGEPFTMRIELTDPGGALVEDAIVHAEADPQADAPPAGEEEVATDPLVATDRFEEVAPGIYATEMVLPEAGPWTLVLRDRTFRQEEARAVVTLRVGEGGSAEPVSFIFPPTATGPQSLTTWLIWLVGLPLVVGAVVTVVVLRGGGEDGDEDGDAEEAAPGGGRA